MEYSSLRYSSNTFITIEGVDGSGKTTVAELLSADGSFQYYQCPGGPFAELRKEIDLHAAPLERYCFYRVANQSDSKQITHLLTNGPVVCDRYVASTAAYHIAMDPRIELIHDETGLLKPHFTFLLSVCPEVRDRRLLQRGRVRSDINLELNGKLLDRVAAVYMSLSLIHIDTNDKTAEQVAMMIRRIVRKRRQQ